LLGPFGNTALEINNQGQVVGLSALPGDTTFHAFLWTSETGMQDLGTLPGDVASGAFGINDRGDVVGLSLDASGNPRAFLRQNGVMTDLSTLIPTDSPLLPFFAEIINSREEIVGLGADTSTGNVHGFLATPVHSEVSSDRASVVRGGTSRTKVTLSENARKQVQRPLRFRRLGFGLVGPQ
jgi:probable HAF family extracellular repeat protein